MDAVRKAGILIQYELRELSPDDGMDIYLMLQDFERDANGFLTEVSGRGYPAYQAWLRTSRLYSQGLTLPAGYVPQTIYWFYGDGEPLGYGKLRHYLNQSLLEQGGHLGYGLRRSQRGKGHGEPLVRLLLEQARYHKIDRLLATIQQENLPSISVAERCGGQLTRHEHGKRYYWFTTDVAEPIPE